MLQVAVIVLAGLYLVLHYAGVFDDLANRRRQRSSSPRTARSVEQEIEKRLRVFEDFFERGEEGDDEPGAN